MEALAPTERPDADWSVAEEIAGSDPEAAVAFAWALVLRVKSEN